MLGSLSSPSFFNLSQLVTDRTDSLDEERYNVGVLRVG